MPHSKGHLPVSGRGRSLRPVGDLYGPFFRVSFLVGATESTNPADEFEANPTSPLIVTGGKSRAQAEIGDHIVQVAASMTAESKAGSPYRFDLTFTPEYDDALHILDSGLLGYATIVQVEWGYRSSDGQNEIKTHAHLFRNIYPKAKFGEHIQITVSGHDIISDIAMRRSRKDPWVADGTRTPKSIIEELLNGYQSNNVIVEVDGNIPGASAARSGALAGAAGAVVGLVASAEPKHELLLPIKKDIQQDLGDWAFINHIIRRLALTFVILASGKKTVFKLYDPIKPLQTYGNVAYIFKWRRALTGQYDVPVSTVDANYLPSMYQPKAARGIHWMQVNDATGLATQKLITGKDTGATQPIKPNTPDSKKGDQNTTPDDFAKAIKVQTDDGQTVNAVPDQTSGAGTRVSQPFEEFPGPINNSVLSIMKSATAFAHPIVKLSCPGVVDLFPGLVTELIGTSDQFDGLYTVLAVKHSVTNNGYDMDVTLMRVVQKGPVSTHVVVTAPAKQPSTGGPDDFVAAVPPEKAPK